jgi:hypothetical protein
MNPILQSLKIIQEGSAKPPELNLRVRNVAFPVVIMSLLLQRQAKTDGHIP